MTIDQFISELAKFSMDKFSNPVYNQYQNKLCQDNLKNYLYFLKHYGTKIVLIGEAPGYRGCRLTGIPFTDEKCLKTTDYDFAIGHWDRSELCGNTSEKSATKVWNILKRHNIVPLMWNAFPFHPYKTGNEQSNRKPTSEELKAGIYFAEKLIEIFGISDSNIYALGRTSQYLLKLSDKQYIRHPSYDYKKEFEEQFCKALRIG